MLYKFFVESIKIIILNTDVIIFRILYPLKTKLCLFYQPIIPIAVIPLSWWVYATNEEKRECGRARHKLRSEGMRLWITRTGPVDAMPVVRTRKPRERPADSCESRKDSFLLFAHRISFYISCFVFSSLILSLSIPFLLFLSSFILERFVRYLCYFSTKIFFDLIVHLYIFFILNILNSVWERKRHYIYINVVIHKIVNPLQYKFETSKLYCKFN